MILKIENVIKRFNERLALDYLSFVVNEGEVIGLLGPNGAGKTTCIKAVIGLLGIDDGNINVFGINQDCRNKEIRRQIGYVTQEVTVYEEMSAKENLEFFGGLYGLKKDELKKRVLEVAKIIGLEDRLNDCPKQFSGGMKRRLNIGCSLLHKPRLLIMDEPTVGIDPQSRKYILDFVKEIAASGTTVIYTSHYIEEVEAVASRVLIMDQGHIIASGSLEELVARISGDNHIIINVSNVDVNKKDELLAMADVKEVMIIEDKFHIVVHSGANILDRIIAIVSPMGIMNVNSKQANLEDVFLMLTGKQLRDGVE